LLGNALASICQINFLAKISHQSQKANIVVLVKEKTKSLSQDIPSNFRTCAIHDGSGFIKKT